MTNIETRDVVITKNGLRAFNNKNSFVKDAKT